MSFTCFLIWDQGIKPDPQKTIAVSSFPTPNYTTNLRPFLGLANQLAVFLPDFCHLTSDMRKLFSIKNTFVFLEIHETE